MTADNNAVDERLVQDAAAAMHREVHAGCHELPRKCLIYGLMTSTVRPAVAAVLAAIDGAKALEDAAAKAWDEGHDAGYDAAIGIGLPIGANHNPYRAAAVRQEGT